MFRLDFRFDFQSDVINEINYNMLIQFALPAAQNITSEENFLFTKEI